MLAIRTEHLGKRYQIGARQRRAGSVRDAVARATSSIVDRLRGRRGDAASDDQLWALDDVSFEAQAGDIIGIIGRNGAGKSTLLKVLSQITQPTTGYADVTGRVGSLLEVGTGFHGDLTGRENTYLNGAILGMNRAEIARKFDEIVAFAEVDRFIDTPVKHYSSGMYMRLAFAVAAHLETEILLVDEVLAVGDAQFQAKCLGKMDDIARLGRTVLFISHNMEAIQRLCGRGMLMDRGKLVATGPIDDVVAHYRSVERTLVDVGRFNTRGRKGTGWARIKDLRLVDDKSLAVPGRAADEDLSFELDIELADAQASGASLRGLVVEVMISSDQGQPLLSVMNVDDNGVHIPSVKACTVTATLPGPTFIPGRYRATIFLGIPYLEHVDEIPDALEFEILPPKQPWRPFELHVTRGIVCRRAAWDCSVPEAENEPRRS